MKKPAEILDKIIDNLQLIKENNFSFSQIEKDIVLQNLRDAYLIVLNYVPDNEVYATNIDANEEMEPSLNVEPSKMENSSSKNEISENYSEKEINVKSEILPEPEPVVVPEPKPVVVPEPEPVVVPEPEPVVVPEPEPVVVPEPEPVVVPEPEPVVVPEPEPVVVPEPEPVVVPEPEPVVVPEPEPVVVPEPEPVVVPEPEPVVVPEPEPVVVPEPEPVVVPEPEPIIFSKPEPIVVPEPEPIIPEDDILEFIPSDFVAPTVTKPIKIEEERVPEKPAPKGTTAVHQQNSLFPEDIFAPPVKPQKKSLNDILNEQHEDNSISSKYQQSKINDLTKAISINDKFLFIRELFKNRGEEFSKVIQTLNNCSNIEEAFDIMETMKKHYFWDTTSSAYLTLCDLVRRKFL